MSNYSDSKFNLKDSNNSWTKTFNMIPEGSTVMDIGCSSGTFGEELITKKNCVVDGIEIDAGDIVKAKKKLRQVYKINVETDAIDVKKKYDIVFMGDVIEHLAQPVIALKKIRELIKPDGHLVFSMPNITHMSVRLMLLKGNIEYGRTGLLDETHLHFYNKEEIYRILKEAGYGMSKFDYVVRDIPRSVAEEALNEIGLKLTKEFNKLLQSLNASAYQFIGSAQLSNPSKQALPEKRPLDITDIYIEKWRKQNDANYKKLEEVYMQNKIKLDNKSTELKLLKEKIIRIENSRVWKTALFTKTAFKAAKRPLNVLDKLKKG